MDIDLEDILIGFTKVGKDTFKRDDDGTLWNCVRIYKPVFGDFEIRMTRLTKPKNTQSS